MMQFHGYTLSDLENMLPWERGIYLDMLHSHLKDEREKERDRLAEMQAKAAKFGGAKNLMRPARNRRN